MKKHPTVAIVVLNWNDLADILRCLESLAPGLPPMGWWRATPRVMAHQRSFFIAETVQAYRDHLARGDRQ